MDNSHDILDSSIPKITIKEYIFIARKGLPIIVLSMLLFFLGSVYYSFSLDAEYRSATTVLVDHPESFESLFGTTQSRELSRITNIISLVRSRRVMQETVKELWNSKHRNFLDVFNTRKYHHRGQKPRRFFKEIFTFGSYNPSDEKPKKYNVAYTDSIGERYYRNILSKTSTNYRKGSDLLTISCTSPFSDEAALLANTVVSVFQRFDRELNNEETLNMRSFLESQLDAKLIELTTIEDALKEFKEKNQIYSIEGNASILLNKSVDVDIQYYESLAEYEIKKKEKDYLQSQLTDVEKTMANKLKSSLNQRLKVLSNEKMVIESELLKNARIYGESHEIVTNLKNQLSKLDRKIEEESNILVKEEVSVLNPIQYRQDLIQSLLIADRNIAYLEARSDEFLELSERYKEDLRTLPEKTLMFARLERDRIVLSEIYSFMRQKLEETNIAVASEAGTIRIIDRALIPSAASSPKHSQNIVFGTILGLLIGMVVIFVREFFDDTIKATDYIDKLGLTTLGIVPHLSTSTSSKRKRGKKRFKNNNKDGSGSIKNLILGNADDIQRRMITREDPKSPISESYRMIRTNILYSNPNKNIQTILVTSPGPGEGKSTTVTNIAITFANLGKKTLLIDSDLRRPVVHKIFDIDRDPGMTHYLSGNLDDHNKLIYGTDIENLSVIPAGITPPNPSELLASLEMSDLLKKLKEDWDIILLDTPPLTAVTDAAIVNNHIDSLVLVVKAGHTLKESLKHCLNSNSLDSDSLGMVLNGVTRQNSYDSYYYYYQYYYHYYGDNKTK